MKLTQKGNNLILKYTLLTTFLEKSQEVLTNQTIHF